MPLPTLLLVLANISLPDAFWSLLFAIVIAGVSALLATWRSSAVYEEKFSNQSKGAEQIKKDLENGLSAIKKEVDAISAEDSRHRITTVEVQMKNVEQLGRDLLKYRETDVKEINRLISEIQQWMSRLETMVEYALEDRDKKR